MISGIGLAGKQFSVATSLHSKGWRSAAAKEDREQVVWKAVLQLLIGSEEHTGFGLRGEIRCFSLYNR